VCCHDQAIFEYALQRTGLDLRRCKNGIRPTARTHQSISLTRPNRIHFAVQIAVFQPYLADFACQCHKRKWLVATIHKRQIGGFRPQSHMLDNAKAVCDNELLDPAVTDHGQLRRCRPPGQ